MERLTREQFVAFDGGFEPLAEAANGEAIGALRTTALKRAFLAGQRLSLVWIMAEGFDDELNGGASHNKASALLEHLRAEAGVAKSDFAINAAWQSHQSIAHLAAGAMFTSFATCDQSDDPSSNPACGLAFDLGCPALGVGMRAEGLRGNCPLRRT